ncbi:F-box protein PP2-B10-like [Helianthus annuus]|uniref:F-box protein PP2-B10-like n=1 Tax=Helianthus annuus TaxID=4232 RepID=UPI001652D68E|nr:F-box protein PP2-B10-like [Helianthus annuus]
MSLSLTSWATYVVFMIIIFVHLRRDKRRLHVIGVEFVPVEYKKDENLEEQNKMHMQPTMDLDTDWEEKLPGDYDAIIKWSKYDMQWTTNKDLYYLLLTVSSPTKMLNRLLAIMGQDRVRVTDVQGLSSAIVVTKSLIDHNERRSHKLMIMEKTIRKVGEVAPSTISGYTQLLSPETCYACYLVYKLPDQKHSMVSGLVQMDYETLNHFANGRYDWLNDKEQYVDLLTPTNIPFIGCNTDEARIPRRARRIKGHPKLRKDGWMEIQVWDFNSSSTNKNIPMHCRLRSYDKWKFTGLLVQGIEFRPAKVSFMPPLRSH